MAKTATATKAEADVTVQDAKETGHIPYRREYFPVTPAMAKSFLDQTHPDQRHHRDAKVDQYAQDMSQGNWREDTEDSILIDWNGYLIDGQNRLRALVDSHKTLNMWVVWGKDPAIMGVKDTGAARTIADSLRISGRGNGMTQAELLTLGAIARRQLHWESGRHSQASMKTVGQATHSDIARILDLQPDIYGASKVGIDASKSTRPPLVTATAYGFFWLNANRIDSDLAYQWQTFWLTPEELPGGSPIAVVRERFFRHKMAQNSRGGFGDQRALILTTDEQLALLIRAWTYFLAGRTANLNKIQMPRGKLNNDNFPVFVSKKAALTAAEKYDREVAARGTKRAGANGAKTETDDGSLFSDLA